MTTDIEKDAERWNKLKTLIQKSYDGTTFDFEKGLAGIECGMIFGHKDTKLCEATIRWFDKRDADLLDLDSAIDQIEI